MLCTDSVDDEDVILQALAEQLGDFVQYVGGPEHVSEILVPLEVMAAAEEVTVRDAVCIWLFIILTHFPRI